MWRNASENRSGIFFAVQSGRAALPRSTRWLTKEVDLLSRSFPSQSCNSVCRLRALSYHRLRILAV